MQYFGSNIVEGVAESWMEAEMSWVEVDGAGWRLMHGLVIPLKKGVIRKCVKFTGKHLCQSLIFKNVAGLRAATILKETLAQVFPSEFCEISKNNFSYKTPLMAASDLLQ